MASNKWINNTWYVGDDGAMYVNSLTPDGAYVDETGAKVAPQQIRREDRYQKLFTQNVNGKAINVYCKSQYEGAKRHGQAEITDMYVDDKGGIVLKYRTITPGTNGR